MKKTHTEIVAHSERVFAMMRGVIEAPDSRLAHYRSDFFKYERNYLAATHAQGEYLWVVRESGTDLRMLGVHQGNHDWLRASMEVGPSHDVYLLNADKMQLTKITEAKAYDLMRSNRYEMGGGILSKDNSPIAHYEVRYRPQDSSMRQPEVDVAFTSTPDGKVADVSPVIYLNVAGRLAEKAASTFFVNLKAPTLDGDDLYELVTPDIPKLDPTVVYYGTIQSSREEKQFLESLGVELGTYNEGGYFPAKVTQAALVQFDPYASSFVADLAPLPLSLKPEGEIGLNKTLRRVAEERLEAYGAFVRYELAVPGAARAETYLALQEASVSIDTEMQRRSATAAPTSPRPAAAAPTVSQGL